jgi:hypothetical protein
MVGDQCDTYADIRRRIGTFHGKVAADEHHRYRSWEHC